MVARRFALHAVCAFAVLLALACSPKDETQPPAPPVASSAETAAARDAATSDAQVDAPPGEVKDTTMVRCLVDTPPGCTGCDQGDSCVYEQKTRYDCVYVIYGTDCSK